MGKVFVFGSFALASVCFSWVSQSFSKGEIKWQAENRLYKAVGGFTEWEVKNIDFSTGEIEDLSLEVELQTASIFEQDKKLTTHLKQEDYFDVVNFPLATVKVSKVEKTDTAYKAEFITTVKGISDTTEAYFNVVNRMPLKVVGHAYVNRPKHELGMPLKLTRRTTKMVKVNFSWEM